jgi:hypothetical protein
MRLRRSRVSRGPTDGPPISAHRVCLLEGNVINQPGRVRERGHIDRSLIKLFSNTGVLDRLHHHERGRIGDIWKTADLLAENRPAQAIPSTRSEVFERIP